MKQRTIYQGSSWRRALVYAGSVSALSLALTPHVQAQTLDAPTKKVTLNPDPATWQSGEPRLNDMAFDLSHPKVLSASPFEEMLRQDFMKLMTDYKNEDALLAPALKDHDQATERWIGYGLAAADDARAVPILEDVLADTPKPLLTKAQGVNLTYLLICLSGYYEKKGELSKAAETQLRALDYSKNFTMAEPAPKGHIPVAGMMANRLLEAARLYESAGNTDKAQQIYTQIPQIGYGWSTVMSYYDHASQVMKTGKYEEAQAILSQPLYPQGVVASKDSNSADAFIAQNALLANMAYSQGHPEDAFRYGQQVMQLGEDNESLFAETVPLYQLGREIYLKTGGWKDQPIQCEIKTLTIKSNPVHPDQPLYARFKIKTYGDTSVSATVDDPTVQIYVLPIDNWHSASSRNNEDESEVIIKASPSPKEALPKTFNLILKSSARAAYNMQIAVVIQQ